MIKTLIAKGKEEERVEQNSLADPFNPGAQERSRAFNRRFETCEIYTRGNAYPARGYFNSHPQIITSLLRKGLCGVTIFNVSLYAS